MDKALLSNARSVILETCRDPLWNYVWKRLIPKGRVLQETQERCHQRLDPGFSASQRRSAILRRWQRRRHLAHGMSATEVFHSIDLVIDAINQCPALAFSFPADHGKQRDIAAGFKRKSKVGFDKCVGAIDCMLLWIEKPSDEDCIACGVDPKKFMCGRKGKFGLVLQAVCDSEGRILDLFIAHPAATSDYLT